MTFEEYILCKLSKKTFLMFSIFLLAFGLVNFYSNREIVISIHISFNSKKISWNFYEGFRDGNDVQRVWEKNKKILYLIYGLFDTVAFALDMTVFAFRTCV